MAYVALASPNTRIRHHRAAQRKSVKYVSQIQFSFLLNSSKSKMFLIFFVGRNVAVKIFREYYINLHNVRYTGLL